MKRSLKACVAYIAARAITGDSKISIYDCAQDKRILVNGTVSDTEADIKHTKKGFHITGQFEKLQDKDNDIDISLTIEKNKFSGRDNKSKTKFKGKYRDGQISIVADDAYLSYRIES